MQIAPREDIEGDLLSIFFQEKLLQGKILKGIF